MNVLGKKHVSGAYPITTPTGRTLWLMNLNYMWAVILPPYVLSDWDTFNEARRKLKHVPFDDLVHECGLAHAVAPCNSGTVTEPTTN